MAAAATSIFCCLPMTTYLPQERNNGQLTGGNFLKETGCDAMTQRRQQPVDANQFHKNSMSGQQLACTCGIVCRTAMASPIMPSRKKNVALIMKFCMFTFTVCTHLCVCHSLQYSQFPWLQRGKRRVKQYVPIYIN